VSTKKILIVDDSPTMRRMIRASLDSLEDVTFNEASNGLEAIERLAISDVDLIVLDLNMPDMHGMEVVQFVREHRIYREIPIVILTTRGDESSRSTALGSGASIYLTKPFLPYVLSTHVKHALEAKV
jgi:two-component system chemotaxis response regulator CheY